MLVNYVVETSRKLLGNVNSVNLESNYNGPMYSTVSGIVYLFPIAIG